MSDDVAVHTPQQICMATAGTVVNVELEVPRWVAVQWHTLHNKFNKTDHY
jgi:hypothetical protein